MSLAQLFRERDQQEARRTKRAPEDVAVSLPRAPGGPNGNVSTSTAASFTTTMMNLIPGIGLIATGSLLFRWMFPETSSVVSRASFVQVPESHHATSTTCRETKDPLPSTDREEKRSSLDNTTNCPLDKDKVDVSEVYKRDARIQELLQIVATLNARVTDLFGYLTQYRACLAERDAVIHKYNMRQVYNAGETTSVIPAPSGTAVHENKNPYTLDDVESPSHSESSSRVAALPKKARDNQLQHSRNQEEHDKEDIVKTVERNRNAHAQAIKRANTLLAAVRQVAMNSVESKLGTSSAHSLNGSSAKGRKRKESGKSTDQKRSTDSDGDEKEDDEELEEEDDDDEVEEAEEAEETEENKGSEDNEEDEDDLESTGVGEEEKTKAVDDSRIPNERGTSKEVMEKEAAEFQEEEDSPQGETNVLPLL